MNKLIKMEKNFFKNWLIATIEIIKISGKMKSICLNSSYKFTSKKTNKKIIVTTVLINGPKINIFLLFEKIFFSIKMKTKMPNKISIGNL